MVISLLAEVQSVLGHEQGYWRRGTWMLRNAHTSFLYIAIRRRTQHASFLHCNDAVFAIQCEHIVWLNASTAQSDI